MATGAVIGALRVVIGADTASLEKSLKDAQATFSNFSNTIKAGLAAIGITATFAAFERSIGGAIDSAEALGKASQKLGIPVEELSKLQYAAKLSDVSLDELTKTIGHFDKGVSEAAGGGTSQFTIALQAMGISVTDNNGKIKTQSELFDEVANKFSTYQDGVLKNALGNVLFGKSFADLIPFLNQGAAGIQKLKDEADRFGVTVSATTAKAAAEFNDDLKRLSAIAGVFWSQLAEALLPALIRFTQALIDLKTSGGGLSDFFKGIGDDLTVLVGVFEIISIRVRGFGAEWEAFKKAMQTPFLSADFLPNWQKFKDLADETEAKVGVVRAGIQALIGPVHSLSLEFGGVSEAMTKVITQAPAVGTATKNALDSFIDSQQKAVAGTLAAAQTTGLQAGAMESLRISLQGAAIATANKIPLDEAHRAKLAEVAAAAGSAAAQLDAARLIQENLTPGEQYIKQLERINAAQATGALTAEQVAQAQRKAAVTAGAAWDVAGASIAGSFATIAGTFGKSSGAMATAAKAFAIVQATLSVYTGMAKALELPFPANIAAVAAVAAQGFTFIANIKSQAVPKFEAGGSFTVGGAGPGAVAVPKLEGGGSFTVPGGAGAIAPSRVPQLAEGGSFTVPGRSSTVINQVSAPTIAVPKFEAGGSFTVPGRSSTPTIELPHFAQGGSFTAPSASAAPNIPRIIPGLAAGGSFTVQGGPSSSSPAIEIPHLAAGGSFTAPAPAAPLKLAIPKFAAGGSFTVPASPSSPALEVPRFSQGGSFTAPAASSPALKVSIPKFAAGGSFTVPGGASSPAIEIPKFSQGGSFITPASIPPAKINIPKFAAGGSFTVPGGASKIDVPHLAAGGSFTVPGRSATAIELPRFAAGGSFRVPGGMSTIDNQLIPLNLASGERVDITPTSMANAAPTTFNIDLRDGDPYYSRGNIEKLLNAMHTVTSDGHQLQLVILK